MTVDKKQQGISGLFMESESTHRIDQHAVAEQDECMHPKYEDSPASSLKSHRKKSTMFHSGVTRLDRWLVKKMVDVVGNPPVRISLWDGIEVTPSCENPVAVMVYCDRGALFKTIVDPELHWGDLYCKGRVKFEGDMTDFMQAIYFGISGKGEHGWLRKAVLWMASRCGRRCLANRSKCPNVRSLPMCSDHSCRLS